MRAAKDSDHFWASSGWGRADNGESEFLRLRNNPDFRFKSRISGLQLYRKPIILKFNADVRKKFFVIFQLGGIKTDLFVFSEMKLLDRWRNR